MNDDDFNDNDVVTNDPEVERLGANATAQYALQFWNTLAEAARKDGQLLDPVWGEDYNYDEAHYTTQIVIAKEGWKLHRRFRSNFGTFSVQHIIHIPSLSPTTSHNPLGGERWTSLLVASEGVIEDYNFMTLLRSNALDMFWMTETDVCHGLLVVPRAQFVFVEVTRIHEKVYNGTFRSNLHLFDIKTQGEILSQALLTVDQENVALQALHQLRTVWPYPRKRVFFESGILGIVKRGLTTTTASTQVQSACQELLQYWQDVMDLGRIPKLLTAPEDRRMEALQRAGRVYCCQGQETTAASSPTPITRTTSSLSHVTGTRQDSKQCRRIFSTFGICVLEHFVSSDTVKRCQEQASQALTDLQNEQLTPRGLVVDGANSFDFKEVRQRPGHRVDNRYHILDKVDSAIERTSRHLLEVLPSLLTNDNESGWKILYGGVVHSFPRATKEDPVPAAQLWHRDGPSLFQQQHHETHCFNVFVPLVDVTTENGTTEFIPGTHHEECFEKIVGNVMELAQTDPSLQHESAVRAHVSAGTVICFDVRVLHRGLANASLNDRPIMYFTMARDWFLEQHMFQETTTSLIEKNPLDDSQQIMVRRLFELVTKTKAPNDENSYGHPHYTTRFDLLLLDGLLSSDSEERARATRNVAAVMALATSSHDERTLMANEFVELLSTPHAIERKHSVLKRQKEMRAEARKVETAAYLDYTDWQPEAQDFSSISTDMSDIQALYELTAEILLRDSTHLSQLGFTFHQDGVCTLLAVLKAACPELEGTLEESFSSWWHAGQGRFSFQPKCATRGERPSRKVLVVFSSLGSGIARPEWSGSLGNIVSSKSSQLDILNVLDPSFSWYCQDPSCQWKGGEYYQERLKEMVEGYGGVMFLGDSMGAAAALRFSTLATRVLAFTPQVDISTYEAITRSDFSLPIRQKFQNDVIAAVQQSRAMITIHYGEHCQEDVRQVGLLPIDDRIKLVPHDYDDHILSLHLRDLGKLQDIVEDAVNQFLDN